MQLVRVWSPLRTKKGEDQIVKVSLEARHVTSQLEIPSSARVRLWKKSVTNPDGLLDRVAAPKNPVLAYDLPATARSYGPAAPHV